MDGRFSCARYDQHMPRHITTIAILAYVIALTATASPPQPKRPANSKSSPINEAIAFLAEEARKLKHDQQLPPTIASFATRFNRQIPVPDLQEALSKPADADAFTDAYIRWQLTSCNPPMPVMDDEQFLKLLATLPALIDNPRATPELVERFKKADKAGSLARNEYIQLREASEELDRRAEIAEAVNGPAQSLRDWLAEKLGSTDPRRLQFMIERCAAEINTGWPCRAVKSQMTKAFKEAAADPALSPLQKQTLVEQTRKLAGLKRTAINHITFLADGSVNVTFTTPAITDADVQKWTKPLLATK